MQERTLDLTRLNGTNGFVITSTTLSNQLGHSVNTAGDVNGDGIEDLVVGAPGNPAVYLVFGSRDGFPAFFNVTGLNGSNGFVVPGIASGGNLGFSVSSAGDINADGIVDLVLGAPYVNYNSTTHSAPGASYVIYGNRSGFPASFNLSNLGGNNGFIIPGITLDAELGSSVSSADINGDGIADLILGAPSTNLNNPTGTVYVIFGNTKGFGSIFNLTMLDGTNGFTILGVDPSGQLGYSVSSVGDINGDGVGDIALGAPLASSSNGAAYVIFGNSRGFASIFNLTMLDGKNGFTIPGIETQGWLGSSVNSAGDVNADGISDFIVGAPEAGNGNGDSYVILGSRNGFQASFNLNNLSGSNGFIIPGIAGLLGWSVSTASDLNADNISDLVLGAPWANSAYVIFGGAASIVFTKNELTIIDGQTVLFSNTNLNAVGIFSPASIDSLIFSITQLQGGRFTFVNDSNTAILNFTQTQINMNQIQFISDHTNIVTYQVKMINSTDNQIIVGPVAANVTFISHPPVVINPPVTQIVTVERAFTFALQADQIFNDPDGDPIQYTASSSGAALPNWLSFTIQSNQLTFSGTTSVAGSTPISLTAKDLLNASVTTGFELLAVASNTTNIVNGASKAQVGEALQADWRG